MDRRRHRRRRALLSILAARSHQIRRRRLRHFCGWKANRRYGDFIIDPHHII